MPNWKSYESSVRLLSAIVAAHPELKLNYNAIAGQYGDGVTSKAVSERFVRLKKEPEWNLANPVQDNGSGGSAKPTPRKRATPKKKSVKNVDSDSDDDDHNVHSRALDTPSKGTNNKVLNGRVGKTTPARAARPAPGRFAENDDDEEDDDYEKMVTPVKEEKVGNYGVSQHNGYSAAPIAPPNFGNGYTPNNYAANGFIHTAPAEEENGHQYYDAYEDGDEA